MSDRHLTPNDLLQVALAGATSNAAHPHLDACESCRLRLTRVTSELGALHDAEPPAPDGLHRRRQILAALNASRTASSKGRSLWLAAATAMAVAIVAAVFWIRRPSHTVEAVAHLQSGELFAESGRVAQGTALPRDAALSATSDATFRVPQGAEVRAVTGARFTLPSAGTAVDLHAGTVSLSVDPRAPDQAFVVQTPEARVTVIGTRFDVRRESGSPVGTTVSVSEGVVSVAPNDGRAAVRLSAGQSVTIFANPSEEPKPAPPEPSAEPAPAPEPSASAPVLPPPSIQEIRARLKAGRVNEAFQMIQQARANPKVNAAELAIVEAEALLASGRGGAAVKAYLDVTRRYPKSRQAEEALFAAAQLSVNPKGKSDRGAQLLRDYLKRYPSGRFKGDAERLLRALEERSSSTP